MLKRIIAFSLFLSFFLLCCTSAVGGTATDPVVTYSYVSQTFKPQILSDAQAMIDQSFNALSKQLDELFGENGVRAGLYASAYLRNSGITTSDIGRSQTYTVSPNSVIFGTLGTTIMLSDGLAYTHSPNGEVIVNITDGEAYLHGNTVIPYHSYIIADEGQIGIRTLTESTVTVSGNYFIIGSATPYTAPIVIDPNNYTARHTKYAHALNALGLFKGTDKGFELERSANRAEAVTMLIRILGEEQQAISFTGTHPFTDVPSWADRYSAYAYNMGYTNGISATKFGAKDPISENQYLTFLLRALGYSDANGDFVWSSANQFALSIGLISAYEESEMRSLFFRDQMVLASYKALYTQMKNTVSPLYEKLLYGNAITPESLYYASLIVG